MSSNLPSRIDAWRRLQAAAPPAWVLGHCRAVEGLTDAMVEQAIKLGLSVDRNVALRGALLHDIGRSITQDLHHAHVGADLLRDDAWPASIVHVVERHTGAGVTPEEAAKHGLPTRDYMPRTLEERIVAHADNLHAGEHRLSLGRIEEKYRARGLEEAWKRIEALHEDLCRELDTDLERLEANRLEDLPTSGS